MQATNATADINVNKRKRGVFKLIQIKAGSGEFQAALNYCKHLRLDLDAKFYAEEVAVYEAEMCYRLGHI